MKYFIYVLIIFLIISHGICFANCKKVTDPVHYLEKEYQKVWCERFCGAQEVILPDKARVDCVTFEYAVEFDFAKKWAESIGQALYYSIILNKKPAVVLIIENDQRDLKYLNRLNKVANLYGITVFTMTQKDI